MKTITWKLISTDPLIVKFWGKEDKKDALRVEIKGNLFNEEILRSVIKEVTGLKRFTLTQERPLH